MRILAVLGRSARIAPDKAAGLVIEMDEQNGRLGAGFAALQCPAVFAIVPVNHLQILGKATGTVIAAIDKVAAARS